MSDRNSTLRRKAVLAAPVAAAWLLMAGAGHAQSMNTNSASFNSGFGHVNGSENQPVNVSMGDVNGNITVINGVITGAASGSIFAGAAASASASAGVGDQFFGAGGSASASAIGNNLSVVTQGNNNTVIVTSVQSNTGDVTANTTVNGRP